MTAERRERRGEGSVHQRWKHGCSDQRSHAARDCPKRQGTWCGQISLGYDLAGNRIRKTVYAKTEPELRKKMKVEQRRVDDHGTVATSDPPLQRYLEDWLRRISVTKQLKPNTLRSYRSAVNLHIAPSIGRIRLSRLSVAHVRRMHEQIIAEHSPSTARNAHRVLGSALADATLEGLVHHNVCSVVKAPPKPDVEPAAVALDLAKRIMREADDSRWYAAFLLGIRQGERLGLRWDFVDLDMGAADLSWALCYVGWEHGCADTCGLTAARCPKRHHPIPKGMRHETLGDRSVVLLAPKSQRSRRIVPLPDLLVDILRRQKEITGDSRYGLVWCKPDGSPIDPRTDWKEWRDLLERLGIAHFKPHQMRHTTATLLMEAGVPERVIQAILGHSSVLITRAYQHASLDLSRAALSGLADRLELTSGA